MNALCLGAADCLWDDVARSELLLGQRWWDVTVACNAAGAAWPDRLDHWVSLHPDKLECVWAQRRDGNDDYVFWADPGSCSSDTNPDRLLDNWGGSSGLFCVTVALELGADRIVCCGMPLETMPHFHGTADWEAWTKFRPGWERHLDEFADVTRSMSGWTRDLLGAPTVAWFARNNHAA